MGRDKRNEEKVEQFTKWIGYEKKLPAWKALGFPAREAYNHLRIKCFAETAEKRGKARNNNGEVFRSPRDLAKDMGCSGKVAMAALADLQAKGWIVCTKLGCLGSHGRGKTSQFRLTMLPTSNARATEDPKLWSDGNDYEVLIHKSYKPMPRKDRAGNFSKNKAPHPNRALPCTRIGRGKQANTPNPASYSGAEPGQNCVNPAPHSGAYLLYHIPTRLRPLAEFRKSIAKTIQIDAPCSTASNLMDTVCQYRNMTMPHLNPKEVAA